MRALLLGFFYTIAAEATPLIEAAHVNDRKTVAALLADGAPPNECNRYGVSPLALACQNGNSEIISLLLASQADPNLALPGKESPLHTAARNGKIQPVALLLKAGATINAREQNGQTPIMWAAAAGHQEVVQLLLSQQAEFSKPLPTGFTPFLFAVRQGHLPVVREFLKHDIDVNEAFSPNRRNNRFMRKGTSALLMAIENGHFELAHFLLEAGAKPNDLRSGYAPLHALTWVRKSVKGDGIDGLAIPEGSGKMTSLELARALVEKGANPNLRLTGGRGGVGRVDHKEATPFLLAAEAADLDYLKLLAELGADPSLTNHVGTTPLLAAAGMGVTAPGEEAADLPSSLKTVRWLVKEHHADLNHLDQRKESVMHAAAYKSAPKMMQLLDELGADPKIWHQKNKSGWTPLRITEGYRPGNFRPIEKSEKALREIMAKRGL